MTLFYRQPRLRASDDSEVVTPSAVERNVSSLKGIKQGLRGNGPGTHAHSRRAATSGILKNTHKVILGLHPHLCASLGPPFKNKLWATVGDFLVVDFQQSLSLLIGPLWRVSCNHVLGALEMATAPNAVQ